MKLNHYLKTLLIMVAIMNGIGLISEKAYAADNVKSQVLNTVHEPISSGQVMQTILGLIAVIVAIFCTAWMAKRISGGLCSRNNILRIVAQVAVGPRERVVLLQLAETQILLGVSPGRVNKLYVLDKPININSTLDVKSPMSFSERLSAAVLSKK